jgi:hypothetical protein
MDAVGHSMDRTVIARIEGGSRKNVTLDEVMALCAAVGLSPVQAVIPWEDAEVVAVAPNVQHPAAVVREWFVGGKQLPVAAHRSARARFAVRVPDEVYKFMKETES